MRFFGVFLLAIVAAVIAEEERCEPGKPYKLYCNTCKCTPDGKPSRCTQMQCNLDIWNKDGTMKYDAYRTDSDNDRKSNEVDELSSITCEPGKPFKLYCNTCMCSSEGKIEGCTRKECNLDVWNKDGTIDYYVYQTDSNADRKRREVKETKSCEPGKPFKLYCNICQCSPEGIPEGCTRMECNPDIWNEDGSIKDFGNEVDWRDDDALYYRKKREAEKPVICPPGKTRRDYCNTCTCSDDGTKLTCTNKRCGPGEFDSNGMRPYQHYDLHL